MGVGGVQGWSQGDQRGRGSPQQSIKKLRPQIKYANIPVSCCANLLKFILVPRDTLVVRRRSHREGLFYFCSPSFTHELYSSCDFSPPYTISSVCVCVLVYVCSSIHGSSQPAKKPKNQPQASLLFVVRKSFSLICCKKKLLSY